MPGKFICFVCERLLEILRGNLDLTFVQRFNNLISRCKKVIVNFKLVCLLYCKMLKSHALLALKVVYFIMSS